MSKKYAFKQCLAGLVLLSGCALVFAQNNGGDTVLKGKQLTREALINALQIEPAATQPNDAEGADPMPEVKTRGFKLATAPQAAPAAASTKPRKASLLITFGVDSAKLTKESMAQLDLMADAMQSKALAGGQFSIEGHADPRGDEGHNLSLSQQRAEAVLSYLVEHRGIDRDSLSAKGKGSSELLNPQQPQAPENRRVTFVNLKQ